MYSFVQLFFFCFFIMSLYKLYSCFLNFAAHLVLSMEKSAICRVMLIDVIV